MPSAMSSSSILPLVIEEKVIDFLAENDKDLLSVKACSLVSRASLLLCRKHIFGSIVLNNRKSDAKSTSSSATSRKLERLLSTNPELVDYIRKLDYSIVSKDYTSLSIQECLKRISRVQSLTVRLYGYDWSDNPL